MLSEFELIARYFTRPPGPRTALGVGDDCALLLPQAGQQLAVSSDMLVAGRHFFPDANPYWLGHKALAVNLSDLAAMGAEPLGFTLALALPEANPSWLQAFAQGLLELADASGCDLVGGDTTRGPLNICITIFGQIPTGQALQRAHAQAGDQIWVSGSLGDARLALAALLGELTLSAAEMSLAQPRLHTPLPRNSLGLALRQIAHAAIDISDGLLGDLGHILEMSGVGAELQLQALPIGQVLATQARARQLEYALTGGDDYELCFTAPAQQQARILQAAQCSATPVTCIGRILATPGLRLLDGSDVLQSFPFQSFDHFRQP